MTSRTINGLIKFQKSLNGMGLTSEVMYGQNNLKDLSSTGIARTNLGLVGNINTGDSGYLNITNPFDGTANEIISIKASATATPDTIIACDAYGNLDLSNNYLYARHVIVADTVAAQSLVADTDIQCDTLYSFSGIGCGSQIQGVTFFAQDSITATNNISSTNMTASNDISCNILFVSNFMSSSYINALYDISCNNMIVTSNVSCSNVACAYLNASNDISCNNVSCSNVKVSSNVACKTLTSTSILCTTLSASTSLSSRYGIFSSNVTCLSLNASNAISCTYLTTTNATCSNINVSNAMSCLSLSATNATCSNINATNAIFSTMNSTSGTIATFNNTTMFTRTITVSGSLYTYSITNNGYGVNFNAKNLTNVATVFCTTMNCTSMNAGTTNLTGTMYCSTFDSPSSLTTGNPPYNIGFNNNNLTNIATINSVTGNLTSINSTNLTCTSISATNVACNLLTSQNGNYTGTLYCSTFDSPSSLIIVQTGVPYNIGFNYNNITNIANVTSTNVSCNTVSATTGTYSGTVYCSTFDYPSNFGSTTTPTATSNASNFFSFQNNSITNVYSLAISTDMVTTNVRTSQIGTLIPFTNINVNSNLQMKSGYSYMGSGSGLTLLNATNITTGTVSPTRLPTQLQCRTLWTPVQTNATTTASNMQPGSSYVVSNARTYRVGVTYKYRNGDTNVMLEAASMYNLTSDKTTSTTIYLELYAVNGTSPLLASSVVLNGFNTAYPNIQLPVSTLTNLIDNTIYWVALSDVASNANGYSYYMNMPLITVYYI